MPSFIQVSHTNPGAVPKRLDRWGAIFGSNLIMETVEKQLDIIYQQMYKITPERTGYLRSTIKVQSGDGFAQIMVTARYARYVNEGTRRTRAQPFWTNSIVGLSVELIIVVRNLFLGNF